MPTAALRSPFYMLAPEGFQLPLVILATMAAIIATPLFGLTATLVVYVLAQAAYAIDAASARLVEEADL